jgi:hypothetical protein
MFRKTCWNKNRFKCNAYSDYINPKSHPIFAKITGVDDASNLTCTWLTAPRNGEQPRGEAVQQPCSEEARFVVPYPDGMVISVEIGGLEVARADVKVRDILVVGMGDSFASGEGNPDIAVRFSRERSADYSTSGAYRDLSGYPARVGPWDSIGDDEFIRENARWLDRACHRSLYSAQLRTALQLAIEDPHRAVTYVGVSCAGAEITNGLFLRYKGNEWVPHPPRLSQLSAVAEAQCGNHKTQPLDLPVAYHLNDKIPELKGLVLRKCPPDDARKIDLVLVSIGGNDIGFSRLLANAVLSSDSLLRQLGGWFGEVYGETEASAQLKKLGPRYKVLNRAIHNILYVPWTESDRILLVAYPGMALQGDGSETCKSGNEGMEVVPDFRLDGSKVKLGVWFADKLNRQMRDSAYNLGWTYVETQRRAFIGHGICAGLATAGVSPVDDLRLPRKINGVWNPYNPADYRPYAPRQRWFRTPNDAFMTANFHVSAGLLMKVLNMDSFVPFELILASTYSGAFHPTAEGEAAIADATVGKARAVLAKYGQSSDSDAMVAATSNSYTEPPPPVPEPDRQIPDVNAVLAAPPAVQPPHESNGRIILERAPAAQPLPAASASPPATDPANRAQPPAVTQTPMQPLEPTTTGTLPPVPAAGHPSTPLPAATQPVDPMAAAKPTASPEDSAAPVIRPFAPATGQSGDAAPDAQQP